LAGIVSSGEGREEKRMSRILIGILALVVLVLAGLWLFTRSGPSVVPVDETSPYWLDADRRVDLEGRSVRVRIEGPETAPVLVMIHGFSFSLESWDAWAADLAADYRVVRMDLPAHGLTGPDPQRRYSIPETVDFTADLLDALEISDATIIGNSLGGLVAWRLAADRPDLATRLVLVAPGAYSINGVTEDPVPVPAGIAFYFRSAPQVMINAATAGLYGDASRMDPAVPERVGDLMGGDGIGDALVERLEVFTLPDPTADLARVTADTLVLWGGLDAMIPVEHADRIIGDLQRARAIIYDDLGHVPHEEDPARTLIDVRAFLED
jgi:pimeloyl-ACP methyl ester carboxylesterase